MRRILTRRTLRGAILAVLLTLTAGLAPAYGQTEATPRALPEPPPEAVVRAELAELVVEPPRSMVGYSRDKFPHWISQGQRCDTREVVLARDGQDVVADEQCRAVSGRWYSEYDGQVFNQARDLDIDHMVPLANAWRSGADEWDTTKRRQFANDLDSPQLIAVSARSNRAKGDQSPDQWQPPRTEYHCTYARAWTHVKSIYDLSVTDTEKDTLNKMLDTCI